MSVNKIYINGKFLTLDQTGVQAYALGIISAMQKQNIPFEVLVPKSVALSDIFVFKRIGLFSNGTLWEQVSLPFFIGKQKEALLINLCNSAPLLCDRQIVTIHDLAFEQKNKQWFSFLFKTWYRFLIPRLCKSAKYVFTVSDFSKNELKSYYRIKDDKIAIIPNGLNSDMPVGKRLIKENYVLMLGGNNPRKNAGFVINNIREIEKLGLKLVVVHTPDTVFERTVKKKHPSIIYMDYVSQEAYYSLIKNSHALIYPSFYEGFGIPILESLCLKTPVVCSDLAVFRNAFGNLPSYFKNNNPVDFSEALKHVGETEIADADVEKLRQKYSFDESVSLILNILKEL